MERHTVCSGTQALDWVVPDEWNIADAHISDLDGNRLVDFKLNNLHVMGYSEPVNVVMTRSELEPHLFSLAEQPHAIPYVTSYYARSWGFCVTHDQRLSLGQGPFRVVIDATLKPGFLDYADVVIQGDTSDEILLSTYICHPSMANNELSGPVVAAAIARWLISLPRRRYTYRLLFAPETIGSLIYLNQHLLHLQTHVKAGWVLTCLGDNQDYSYLPSRLGGTLADRVSLDVLNRISGRFSQYSFLQRGSDERQWCSPGADLPVCSVMRTKYGEYPEYHTSLDDLNFVTAEGLRGGFDVIKECIITVESNSIWCSRIPGEPQLGRRGLYPTTSIKGGASPTRAMMNVLAYCDGSHDLLDIARITSLPFPTVVDLIRQLAQADVVFDCLDSRQRRDSE
jgi:aminopeptidase-like protein